MSKEPFKLKYPASIRPEVLADFELSDRDKIIYAVIASLIGGKQGGYCWLTNAELAEACAKDERSIKRAIKNLSDKDYIYIDTDRSRVKKNKPIRHIYTDYKYFCDRNKQEPPIPSKFKNIHHFRNWAKNALGGFTFKAERHNGNKLKVMITNSGYLMNVGLDQELHPIDEKGDIYKIWADLYKNKDKCIKWYKEHKLNKKEEK